MKLGIGLGLFMLGTAVGLMIGDAFGRNAHRVTAAARADCAALEPRIAKLEAAAPPSCIQVERWQLDIYTAPALGTRPRVAKQ